MRQIVVIFATDKETKGEFLADLDALLRYARSGLRLMGFRSCLWIEENVEEARKAANAKV